MLVLLLMLGGGIGLGGALNDSSRDLETDLGDGLGTGGSAREVTESFLAAVRAGECDQAYSFVAEPRNFPGSMKEDLFKDRVCARAPTESAGTTVIDQSDRTATVRVGDKGEDKGAVYLLRKADGRWLIDPLASAEFEG